MRAAARDPLTSQRHPRGPLPPTLAPQHLLVARHHVKVASQHVIVAPKNVQVGQHVLIAPQQVKELRKKTVSIIVVTNIFNHIYPSLLP